MSGSVKSDSERERCPSCGEWYEIVTSHWSRSECPYPEISEYKMDVLKGLVMGDGNINTGGSHPSIEVRNTNKTFLDWLSSELGWLVSSGVRMESTASEMAKMNRDQFNRDTEGSDCFDLYRLWTRRIPQLSVFREWYSGDGISYPNELFVSRDTLRIWYCCDGGLVVHEGRNPYVQFSSRNESDTPSTIVSALRGCGFSVSNTGKTFYLHSESTQDFFNYIGQEPVSGFEYKWCYTDVGEYRNMKEKSVEEHHTQTLS